MKNGISLYLQGTLNTSVSFNILSRYIPVPTGNSFEITDSWKDSAVYPCTYRELI